MCASITLLSACLESALYLHASGLGEWIAATVQVLSLELRAGLGGADEGTVAAIFPCTSCSESKI